MENLEYQFFLEIFAWLILALSFVVAALGTVLPGLPGAVFVVVGVIIHKLIIPDVFSWLTVGILCFLAAASWLVDFLAGLAGAKLGGATKYGLIGASLGSLVFFIIGFPGLIVGPFFGAILGDLYAKRRDLMELFKSGLGAAMGFFISVFARLIILIIMGFVVLFSIMV